jgi:hypothetical protein
MTNDQLAIAAVLAVTIFLVLLGVEIVVLGLGEDDDEIK